jgi:hypothetical protein
MILDTFRYLKIRSDTTMKVFFWIVFILSLIASSLTIIDLVNGINFVEWDLLFVIIPFSLSIGGFGYLFRKILFKGNNIIKIILIVLVILFGVYVWPTPYKYMSKISDKPTRMHRITGKIELYYGGRWKKY